MRDQPHPTENELELLACLWSTGGGTIAEIHRSFDQCIAYPTVQIRLNRLVEKGWATKSAERPTCYVAALAPEDVARGRIRSLLEKVTGGRIAPLVAELVGSADLSDSELAELRELIDAAERERTPGRRKKPRTSRKGERR